MNVRKSYKQVNKIFSLYTNMCLMALAICIVLTIFSGVLWLFLVETLLFVALILYNVLVEVRREKKFTDYMSLLIGSIDNVAVDSLLNLPLPMVILELNGVVSWYNSSFADVFQNEDFLNQPLQNIVSSLRWSEVLKFDGAIEIRVSYNERSYNVVGKMVKKGDEKANAVLLYWLDVTETEQLKTKYDAERSDVAIITIDNYDEIMQSLDDNLRQQVISQINRHINEWALKGNSLLKKVERDRYVLVFEHQALQMYIEDKFSVVDAVRAIGEQHKTPVTISIGVGTNSTLLHNDEYARNAIDIALGRGGDQAVVKDGTQFSFYGGKTKEYEKSTRVRTRAVAHALQELILGVEDVVIMGHQNMDVDSLGAAMGLQRVVRTLGKKPHIVFKQNNMVEVLFNRLTEVDEYKDMFIDYDEAEDVVGKNTLLVIVDTHKPSLVDCPELLEKTKHIVVIDHHRRGAEFIANTALVYHEPYASSACEMVTELLQYIDKKVNINNAEAEALYAGILIDTKSFILKTSTRTFEAAGYLRKYGLDTVKVKLMFRLNMEDYTKKSNIVKTAKIVNNCIAIATCKESYKDVHLIVAQAADELLNINDVSASFVLCQTDSEVIVSARSLGDINVQLILEKLGGGGHMTIAGVQIKNVGIDKAEAMLRSEIEKYMKDEKE